MKIAVIDGQGGGIGRHITERIRKELPPEVQIIALGTNALATSAMLKAGANDGATGENAICYMAPQTNIITGSIAILAPHAMMGELTPSMAAAIATAPAPKILLPINRLEIEVVGVEPEPLPYQIDKLILKIKQYWRDKNV